MLLASWAYFSALKIEAVCSSETSVTYTGIHGVASQRTVMLAVTALRSTNSVTYALSTQYYEDDSEYVCVCVCCFLSPSNVVTLDKLLNFRKSTSVDCTFLKLNAPLFQTERVEFLAKLIIT
jgi:uncharacterized protein YsxB (DUF464 family)